MKLRKVHKVAYVRFASVFRQFKDINIFMEELNRPTDGGYAGIRRRKMNLWTNGCRNS